MQTLCVALERNCILDVDDTKSSCVACTQIANIHKLSHRVLKFALPREFEKYTEHHKILLKITVSFWITNESLFITKGKNHSIEQDFADKS